MTRPARVLVGYLKKLGYQVEKLGTGEIYRVDSQVIWFDYSRERPDDPGSFFHGTSKRIFEDFYGRFPGYFFIVFLLGYPEASAGIVVDGRRFKEIMRNKGPDTRGDWKYQVRQIGDRYFLKTWGTGDFDITDGLHKYELLGLTHEQALSIREELASIHPRNLLTSEDPDAIIDQFREWLKTNTAQTHLTIIEREKHDVQALMTKLRGMDKAGPEFDEWVLYGLLPYSKTKYAKRVSTFAVFQNLKAFFKDYGYSDADWHFIALSIFKLADRFANSPDSLGIAIREFTDNKRYSRGFQCGSITPILFCINDSFPIVNNRVIHTYDDFATLLNWNDNLHQRLEFYLENVQKCKRLIDTLAEPEFQDFAVFDLFCYWYDQYYRKEEEPRPDIEEEMGDRTTVKPIDFVPFVNSLNLENVGKFDPRSLKNPDTIMEEKRHQRFHRLNF